MEHIDMDISSNSSELKKMPFSTPEGYFDKLKYDLRKSQPKPSGLWGRLSPYATVAAVFIFLVMAGTFILERSTPQDGMTEEDYILFSDNTTNTLDYQIYAESQIADAEIHDEDIINYLIYSGITVEEVEWSK